LFSQHDDRGAGGAFGHDDRSGGGGAFRRGRGVQRNNNPYDRQEGGNVEAKWQHDRFEDEEEEEEVFEEEEFDDFNGNNRRGNRAGGSIETGTRLLITNLAFNVLNEDLKDLFEQVGDVKKVNVHFDKSGRSLGKATVVFSRRNDAVTALKKFNNVSLDDSPMKIELVGTNVGSGGGGGGGAVGGGGRNNLRSAAREALTISVNNQATRRVVPGRRVTAGGRNARVVGGRPRGGGGGGGGGAGGRGRGRGGGRGGFNRKPVTSEQLDAEMDEYNNAV